MPQHRRSVVPARRARAELRRLGQSMNVGRVSAGALEKLGQFQSAAAKNMRNTDLSPEMRSLAGQQMSFLSRNPVMSALGRVGRGGELADLSGGLTALSVGFSIYGSTAQDDPFWKAAIKGSIVAGAPYMGAYVGIGAGAGGGALMLGPDLTGIPRTSGSVRGWPGGRMGRWPVHDGHPKPDLALTLMQTYSVRLPNVAQRG